jgi:hypothetical protein
VVAALGGVLRMADVLVHLDLQAGLEHLLRETGQQTARPDKTDPVGTCLRHQLISQQPIRPLLLVVLLRWLRHHHILVCHCLSSPASGPPTVSGQTSYTADPTVPG